MTVFVIDGSRFVRRLTVSTLNAAGFEAEAVEDGRQALNRLLTAERPSLILLDHVTAGWLFCAELRRHPALLDLPVVLHSSSETIEQDAIVLGAVGYVSKPTSREALVGAVRRCCGT